MRIISKFKDFYDCIQGMGYDEYPVYVREKRQIKTPEHLGKSINEVEKRKFIKSVSLPMEHMPSAECSRVSRGGVAFCGRLYPFFQFDGRCFYDLDKLLRAMRAYPWGEYGYEETRQALLRIEASEKKVRRKWRGYRRRRSRWGHPKLSRDEWERFQEEATFEVPQDTFRYFDSPIIATSFERDISLEINPMLKDYNFEQVKDPYTAWQEISMFMGNELANQRDPNPPISDVLRAQSKGFDKMSFRRHADEGRKARKK